MQRMPHVLFLIDTRIKLSHEILLGISQYVKQSGPWLIEKDLSNYIFQAPLYNKKRLEKMHVDGIVCLNLPISQHRLIEKFIHETKVPVLAKGTNENIKGAINIVSDNNLISSMAAEHLRSLGLQNFAFYGFEGLKWSAERRQGFVSNLSKFGFQVNTFESSNIKNEGFFERNLILLSRWLEELPKPIGIMACNDDFGMMLLQCCHQLGIKVPEEIAVIGVNNNECICELCTPSLSSIARDAQRAGFDGASLLDSVMKENLNNPKEVEIKSTHIVSRRSTDFMAVTNSHVLDALHFIKKNIAYDITVNDVVDQVMISRRNLDDKFVKSIGRTVHLEITRLRIEKICELLRTTNMPLSKIAYECHFSDSAQLGGYFFRHKGISPGKYRQQYTNA